MTELVDGFVFYMVFLFSTTLHEAAHAWAALKGGDSTAYEGGQVTLDPLPNIRREPMGMIVIPIISVILMGWPLGFASAPYNVQWAQKHPRRAAWMALAGPGANLLLVIVAAVLINIGLFAGVFDSPDSVAFAGVPTAMAGTQSFWEPIAYLLGSIFALNLLLFVFNLLPVPPLDGSAAIVLGLPDSVIPKYQRFLWGNPMLGLIGILIAWRVFDDVFDPMFRLGLNLLYLLHGVSYG